MTIEWRTTVAGLAVLLAATTGCGGDDDGSGASEPGTSGAAETTVAPAAPQGDVDATALLESVTCASLASDQEIGAISGVVPFEVTEDLDPESPMPRSCVFHADPVEATVSIYLGPRSEYDVDAECCASDPVEGLGDAAFVFEANGSNALRIAVGPTSLTIRIQDPDLLEFDLAKATAIAQLVVPRLQAQL